VVWFKSMAKTIKLDKNNVRIHPDANKVAIKNSLAELGAGRSILLDADDVLIAGNGVFEQAQALGLPVKVIESDGTELIAVKRTDLSTDDEKRIALAIADNRLTDLSDFDDEALNKMLDELSTDMAELAGYAVNPDHILCDEMTDGFSLPDGDKSPFQQITFTLADTQAEDIKTAISEAKGQDDFGEVEVYGNENSNGNAIYKIVSEWVEQKTS